MKSDERVLYTTIDIENPEKSSYYPYVTGVKSGFTDEAGRCLITKATKNGMTYLLVTLGANRDRYYENNMAFTDAVTLFEYHFAQYSVKTILDTDTVLGAAQINNGVTDRVDVKADSSIETLVALDDKPVVTLHYNEEIKAPIQTGDILGSVTVELDGETYTRNVIAVADVKEKTDKPTFDELNDGNKAATYMDIASVLLFTISLIILVLFLIRVFKKRK